MFVDYLTKWPEAFPAEDQTALTVAKLFVTEIVPRHGVPSELLSDCGSAFLSSLMFEVYQLLGVKKTNTTAYHPQTDGLVERFHRTLTDMLAKTTEPGGVDWDDRLPFTLFAYRASLQESTQESPFYLLYGRDPQLPTTEMLSLPKERCLIDVGDYIEEITTHMSTAWERAQGQVKKAQKKQKQQHDKHAHPATFSNGDRVFVYMPAKTTGKTRKFARPFHGPYRVLEVFEQGVSVRPIDDPRANPIRVSLDRVRRCPEEMPDAFWPNRRQASRQNDSDKSEQSLDGGLARTSVSEQEQSGVWKGRLRPRRTG